MKQQLIFILNELEEMPQSSIVKELTQRANDLLNSIKGMTKEEFKEMEEKLGKEVDEIWEDINYERDVTRDKSIEEIENR